MDPFVDWKGSNLNCRSNKDETFAKTRRPHHRFGHHDQRRSAVDRAETAHARAGRGHRGGTATPIEGPQASHSEEGGQDQEGRQDLILAFMKVKDLLETWKRPVFETDYLGLEKRNKLDSWTLVHPMSGQFKLGHWIHQRSAVKFVPFSMPSWQDRIIIEVQPPL